jgi:hypothetical protein
VKRLAYVDRKWRLNFGALVSSLPIGAGILGAQQFTQLILPLAAFSRPGLGARRSGPCRMSVYFQETLWPDRALGMSAQSR